MAKRRTKGEGEPGTVEYSMRAALLPWQAEGAGEVGDLLLVKLLLVKRRGRFAELDER
jgi:hypothetical protein